MIKKVQREKAEQAHIHQLLTMLKADVYVLGTRRRAGKRCPMGTRQTSGLPDLLVFLPWRPAPEERAHSRRQLLMIEAKAPGGRRTDAQNTFRDLCLAADVHHVTGGLDDVIGWLLKWGYLKPNQVAHYHLPQTEAR